MEFIRVEADYQPPDDELPTLMFIEVDPQRWPTRQIDVFADGRIEWLTVRELATFIPAQVPSVDSINEDPTFVAAVINREEFEEAWANALQAGRAQPRWD